MSDEPRTSDARSAQCGDVSTWLHNRERVDAFTLGTLIGQNGGTEGLDLHGANLADVDLSPEIVAKLAAETHLEYFAFWSSRKHAELRGAHLECASLWNANLAGVDFHEAHMEGARLTGARLDGASFERAHLHHADLSSAHLEEASFQGAFLDRANLDGADLSRANLRGASLRTANLLHVSLRQAALQGAHLEDARILHANLGGAMLVHAHLEGAIVQHTTFENASLKFARLQGAILEGCDLARVDLSESYLTGVRWYGAFLDRSRMRRDQLGHAIGDELWASDEKTAQAYREASEAYLLLKNNFSSIGRYEDAAWAYVKEQQMEKMAYHWGWRWRFWRPWPAFGRWLRNWAYELLTGYGERPFLPVLWGLVVILTFAGGYAVAGNIAPDFAGDPATAQGSHSFMDALTHSIAAFATIGFNTLEPLGWGARLLTAIESAFGIGLFALFIFTLGNRMSRS